MKSPPIYVLGDQAELRMVWWRNWQTHLTDPLSIAAIYHCGDGGCRGARESLFAGSSPAHTTNPKDKAPSRETQGFKRLAKGCGLMQ